MSDAIATILAASVRVRGVHVGHHHCLDQFPGAIHQFEGLVGDGRGLGQL